MGKQDFDRVISRGDYLVNEPFEHSSTVAITRRPENLPTLDWISVSPAVRRQGPGRKRPYTTTAWLSLLDVYRPLRNC